jgi:hypothetical protein
LSLITNTKHRTFTYAPPRRVRLPCSLSFLPTEPVAAKHTCARLRHRPHARLAGVGRPGHHRSPPAPTSRSKHRLHLAHPVLASACHGKAPVSGNCSPEPSRAHRRAPLRALPLSAPPFLLSLSASCSPRSSVLKHPFPRRLLAGDGRRHAPAPPLCHYRWRARTGAPSARSAGAPESPRCGEHDGAHPVARDLTVSEFSSSVISPLSVYDRWG